MKNRKMLYGYYIEQGVFQLQGEEAAVVQRIMDLYIEGLSYLKISDILNNEGVPFSQEAPLWNKHKVKRLLENPRYTGTDGYPVIIKSDVFQEVQRRIREKTSNRSQGKAENREGFSTEESTTATYVPSGEVIRLTNAINRALEHPETPEDVVDLILQGISARYDCLR